MYRPVYYSRGCIVVVQFLSLVYTVVVTDGSPHRWCARPRSRDFMVAWFTGIPTHLKGGDRVWSRLTLAALCVCAQMGDASKTTAASLPLFEKVRPMASVVIDWLKVAKPLLIDG